MKKETKKIFFGILAAVLIIGGLGACNNNKTPAIDNSGSQITSGNEQKVEDLNTYNNGGAFVQYKGKTYYREYTNADIAKTGLFGEYAINTDAKNSKYVNAISANGKVENIFEDDGYGDFYIMNDRFFFSGYNNKLYSVDMKGENYREICKGAYVKCDEKNNKIYYKNYGNDGALYTIDTKTLKITKIVNENLSILAITDEKIIFDYFNKNGEIVVASLNLTDNSRQDIAVFAADEAFIEAKVNGYGSESYYIADSVQLGNKIFLSVGYDSGTLHAYEDGTLYCVDIEKNTSNLIEKGIDRNLTSDANSVYYKIYNIGDGPTPYVKKVNSDSLAVSIISDKYTIEYGKIMDNTSGALAYLNEDLEPKVVVSNAEVENFKEKYGAASGDSNYMVKVKNVEFVGDKVYYLMELSKYNEKYSIGWRDGYERVASEIYMYDINTNKKTLLYLYKANDKVELSSGDVYESGNFEEPLAENEMYLEIKLKDKGLKETFDIRVEEVGGLIIGKRIEYEGTHSRNEDVLKIKVTKEIGAMLTVYIDGKMDSQMLIEE